MVAVLGVEASTAADLAVEGSTVAEDSGAVASTEEADSRATMAGQERSVEGMEDITVIAGGAAEGFAGRPEASDAALSGEREDIRAWAAALPVEEPGWVTVPHPTPLWRMANGTDSAELPVERGSARIVPRSLADGMAVGAGGAAVGDIPAGAGVVGASASVGGGGQDGGVPVGRGDGVRSGIGRPTPTTPGDRGGTVTRDMSTITRTELAS